MIIRNGDRESLVIQVMQLIYKCLLKDLQKNIEVSKGIVLREKVVIQRNLEVKNFF